MDVPLRITLCRRASARARASFCYSEIVTLSFLRSQDSGSVGEEEQEREHKKQNQKARQYLNFHQETAQRRDYVQRVTSREGAARSQPGSVWTAGVGDGQAVLPAFPTPSFLPCSGGIGLRRTWGTSSRGP